jgi:hypothetical protein
MLQRIVRSTMHSPCHFQEEGRGLGAAVPQQLQVLFQHFLCERHALQMRLLDMGFLRVTVFPAVHGATMRAFDKALFPGVVPSGACTA